MGKVKKSVKKFAAKGPEAAKKAVRTHKLESAKRQKAKAAQEHKALAGTGKKKKSRGDDSDDEEEGVSAPSLEGMDVDAFMEGMGASGDEDNEDEVSGSEAEDNDEEEDEESDEDEEDNDTSRKDDDDAESDEEVADMKGALNKHKAELAALQEKDPEFFKYLQENNTDLLDFESEGSDDDEGGEEDLDEDDAGEGGSEDEGDEDGGSAGASSAISASVPGSGAAAAKVLTTAELKAVSAALSEEHSFRGLKKLLDMFRCGCLVSQPEAGGNLPDARKYVVPSAAVFNTLMVTALQRLHAEFAHHVPLGGGNGSSSSGENASGQEKLLVKHPQWKKLEPLALAFFKACLGLLGSITEPSLLSFVLKQLRYYFPYMAPFPKVAKKYLKALLSVWGESQAPDAEARSVQIAAFFRLRQLAIVMPFPCAEDCLKGLYLTYARNARFVNDQSLPVLTFMGNCVVELYGLELASSYQHAFVYVRQLALLLRNALVKKTKDSVQAVFNWQYLSCLRCWAAVVSAYPDQLSGLAYPLTQVLMGVVALATSPRLVPFKLHCVRLLNQLAASSGTYIPTASLLLDVLKLGDLHKKPKPATDLPPRLGELLRFDASGIATRHQQDAVFNATSELLAQTMDVYKHNAAFPELAAPVTHTLNKLAKDTTIGRWRAVLKGQLETMAKQSLWINQKRTALVGGPGRMGAAAGSASSSGLETFRPAGQPSAQQRLEAAAAEKARARAAEVASDLAKGKYKGPKPTFPKGGPRKKGGAAEAGSGDDDDDDREEKPRGKKKAKKQKKGVEGASSSGVVPSADGDDVVHDGFDWDDDDDE